MIDKQIVTDLVEQWLEGSEYFLVDVQVDTNARIVVEIDHKDGVWIEDCVELSKFIEAHLNRDEEDYELEVGSAGLGQPFKVVRQYENHTGKQVEVLTEDGKKLRGILKEVNSPEFTITVQEKQKEEGKKKARLVDVDKVFNMNEVKYTKYRF
ncbi:MAG: ribosome assembly cofactor RimP [Prevotella sp.]|nr:ribosome assembly cofactor RimP [Candidatus Equicola faecalis]MDO4818755.1 ribosome assembly cofactor RimP [Prevotella sp.]